MACEEHICFVRDIAWGVCEEMGADPLTPEELDATTIFNLDIRPWLNDGETTNPALRREVRRQVLALLGRRGGGQ